MGAPRDRYPCWLVNEDGKVDMCPKHSGYDADVQVTADLRLFVEAWRGLRDMRAEIEAGRIKLEGPQALKRDFWIVATASWLQGQLPVPAET